MSATEEKFTLVSPKGEKKEYTMKFSMWLDDQSDQLRLVDVEKNLNIKELWVSRIERATGIKRDDILRLQNWEMSALILKWFEMNDVNKGTFLSNPPSSLDESTSSTQS